MICSAGRVVKWGCKPKAAAEGETKLENQKAYCEQKLREGQIINYDTNDPGEIKREKERQRQESKNRVNAGPKEYAALLNKQREKLKRRYSGNSK